MSLYIFTLICYRVTFLARHVFRCLIWQSLLNSSWEYFQLFDWILIYPVLFALICYLSDTVLFVYVCLVKEEPQPTSYKLSCDVGKTSRDDLFSVSLCLLWWLVVWGRHAGMPCLMCVFMLTLMWRQMWCDTMYQNISMKNQISPCYIQHELKK